MKLLQILGGGMIDTTRVEQSWSGRNASSAILHRTSAGAYILEDFHEGRLVGRRLGRVQACEWLMQHEQAVPDELLPIAEAMLE